jgi:hypothetical protein
MDYTEKEERDFVKGFNSGYLLEKHEEELTKTILDGLQNTSLLFTIGLKAGSKEYQNERLIEQLRQSMQERDGQDNERSR